MIARIVAELIPFSFELLMKGVSPRHILTSLSLFQLVNLSVLSESALSRSPPASIESQLRVLFGVSVLADLSILLWLFGWILLQTQGV
jgi:hypothetical protein